MSEKDDRIEVRLETGSGKSGVIRADLIYTTNGSDELRERSVYEEWHRIRATVENGTASALAPPGMTHGIFCLRDENGFLIRSKEIPPSNGPGSVRNFIIANSAENTFAYRPGLIALLKVARTAAVTARGAKLDTIALEQAIASAEAVVKQPSEEKSSATAMRTLRRAIRALDVPEAKVSVLHLFDSEKW